MSGLILLLLRILMVAALYAFMGWALWLLWRDLRRQSEISASARVPPLTLVLRDNESTEPYHFSAPEVFIGRNPACQCHLDEATISAQHARLSYHHSQWWVEDLHSRNGTFLNQEPANEPLVLTSGDQLRCGQVIFQVLLGGFDSSV